MSLEDLRSIQSRVANLQQFIQKVSTKDRTSLTFFGDLQPIIDEALDLLPNVPYDVLIQDVNKYLPDTIDAKLKNLGTQAEHINSDAIDTGRRNFVKYASHIMSEVTDITTQLQNFRISHTQVTVDIGGGGAQDLNPQAQCVSRLLARLRDISAHSDSC
jgi:hypothetical protein